MAYQLVYSSAAKLLDAGRSGFGTVARSKAITPLVVSAVERVSQFANIRGTDRSRVIFVHRKIVAANNRFHLLSRICNAGVDYTGRSNHIAHHLVIPQDEVALAAAQGINPADILRQYPWLSRWDGAARFLGPDEDVALEVFQPLGQQSERAEWARVTGHPSQARLLAWDGAPRTGVLLVPRGADLLALMGEALHEFGNQSWSRSFTTSLETTDEMSDLDWIVSSRENFPEIQGRCGSRTIYDLGQAHTLPVPPEPVLTNPEPQHATIARAPDLSRIAQAASAPTPLQPSPHVQVVKVRVIAGPPARSSSPVPSVSASRKQRRSLILASAAALVVLGFLGVATWKTLHPVPEGKTAETEGQQGSVHDKEVAERILAGSSIPKKEIGRFLNTVTNDPGKWAKFVTGFIEGIKGNDPARNPAQLPEPPGGQNSFGPNWLESLAGARTKLRELRNDQPLSEYLKSLGIVTSLLKQAARELGSDGFNEQHCLRFDQEFVRARLEAMLGADRGKPLDHARLNELKNAINDGCLSETEWPGRRQVIRTILPEESARLPGFNYEPGPQSRATTTEAPTIAAKKPDLEKVARKQVIVVSRTQLSEGVSVGLLKAVVAAHAGGSALDDHLVVTLDETKIPSLVKVAGADRFSENFMSGTDKISITNDGRLAINRNGIEIIALSYTSQGREWKSLIAVDAKEAKPLVEGLEFNWEPRDGDTVSLGTPLSEWITATVPDKGMATKLKVLLSPPVAGVQLDMEGTECLLKRPQQQKPLIVFSERDAKDLKNALAAYAGAAAKHGNTDKEKDLTDTERRKALDFLDEILAKSIGGGILSMKLALGDESLIARNDMERVRRIFTNDYDGKGDWGKGSDWEKEIDVIKKRIGASGMDQVLSTLKVGNWKELKVKKTVDPIANTISNILEKTKQPAKMKSLAEELETTRTIAVLSPSGRVLFQATKRN